jgi:hypothetical protein
MSKHYDHKLAFLGNHYTSQNGWNKKLCFEARDVLFECADAQENGNKFRCPDELYAYEMWCPNDFRRIHSQLKRRRDLEDEMYDKEDLDAISERNNTITGGRWVQRS